MVHPYNEIELSRGKEGTTNTHSNTDESQKHCAEGKKNQTQKSTYGMFPFT